MGDRHNLTINGSGSYGGGGYEKINIRGEGTITSDFDCSIFKTFGSSTALKSGKADKFIIFGESDIHGNLECTEMKILGTSNIRGSANIQNARIFGTLSVGENIHGEEIILKGSLSVKKDAEFEKFCSTGAFNINGLLNADIVDISLRYDISKTDEIGGNKITVKKKSSIFPFRGDGKLETRVIEGDEIFLENTMAEIVRGKSVHIGTGCVIKLVEYESDLLVDSTSKVLEYRKSK
ncbi:cytoplasmic protein [Bacillus sp. S/N-304-OC-R1]|uniref:cytoplasmic protein n=1 Tax=Bacillus sp. S/N-304-OC-R1 TaxID=2758034 RepID=UPI001C8D0A8D|nr:cytoplasmic protein [Bacillus sp. S/N-304-OC-R1]MBY0120346.1 cytoplasmic protein [Bacillus sp. S/N-304-OC-R1]